MSIRPYFQELHSRVRLFLTTNPSLHKTFTILGALILASKFFLLSASFYRGLLRPSKNLPQRYGKGSWAVITGGSDGIGKAFAIELAQQGFNICIIARDIERFNKTKTEIKLLKPDCQVNFIQADFTRAYEPGYFDNIYLEMELLDVSILVNNVGFSEMTFFHEGNEKKFKDMIAVNCITQALITRKLIKKLNDRKKRNWRSAIVNVSSAEGVYTMPYMSLYSATKAFNDFFSRALAEEFKENIDILSVRPFGVSTLHEKGIRYVTPEQCVKAALRNLGYEITTFGHWKHDVQAWVVNLMPRLWMEFENKVKGPEKVREAKDIERRFNERRKNILEDSS